MEILLKVLLTIVFTGLAVIEFTSGWWQVEKLCNNSYSVGEQLIALLLSLLFALALVIFVGLAISVWR